TNFAPLCASVGSVRSASTSPPSMGSTPTTMFVPPRSTPTNHFLSLGTAPLAIASLLLLARTPRFDRRDDVRHLDQAEALPLRLGQYIPSTPPRALVPYTRHAGQIGPPQQDVTTPERPRLGRITRAPQGDRRRADRGGQVHRTRVVRDQEIARREPRREERQVRPPRDVQGGVARNLRRQIPLRRPAEDDDLRPFPGQPPRDGGEPLRVPSPRRCVASRKYADDGTIRQPRDLAPPLTKLLGHLQMRHRRPRGRHAGHQRHVRCRA